MSCVLKKEEINIIFNAASKDGNCSWRDLIEYGIKNRIDSRLQETVYPSFPPAVQVILNKLLTMFAKMDLDTKTAFNYLTCLKKDLSLKPEFTSLIQGFNIPMNEEELLGLYTFFDEKSYGEVNKVTFIEKCDLARNFSKWADKGDEIDTKTGSLMTLTLRQHVMSVLEEIYKHFTAKKFNKTQIAAVFDKHGTGIISREEFVEILETLKINIPLDHITSTINFVDSNETGVMHISDIIGKMVDSVPDYHKNADRNIQALSILDNIVKGLKVHGKQFFYEFMLIEKKMQMDDLLPRSITGVSIFEFYRLLGQYGIRLQESEKLIVNSAYRLKKHPEFFDTENLYLTLDRIARDVGSFQIDNPENLDFWENGVLKKIANRLREMNLTLEKAFNSKDVQNFGLKVCEFKQLLDSLQIELSQRDIDTLVERLSTARNPNIISFDEFRKRFWICFSEGRKTTHHLNIESRTKSLASNFLNKIKFDMGIELPTVWNFLDRKKKGYGDLEDIKGFMTDVGMPATKEDLGLLFALIDKNSDGKIDQFEFFEFWNLSLPADFDARKTNLKKIESDIMVQLVKNMNARGLDLYDIFVEVDLEKKGWLGKLEFGNFTNLLQISVQESTTVEIMKIISPELPTKVNYTCLETMLLRHGLKQRTQRLEEIVEFKNSLLEIFSNSLNIGASKAKMTVSKFVRQFDEDYDGFLKVGEFCKMLQRLPKNFTTLEIQRLAHMLTFSLNSDRISCERITNLKIGDSQDPDCPNTLSDQTATTFIGDSVTIDVFKSVLEYFDPTLLLFLKLNSMKTSKIKVQSYLTRNKDKIRGLRVLGLQKKLLEADGSLKSI